MFFIYLKHKYIVLFLLYIISFINQIQIAIKYSKNLAFLKLIFFIMFLRFKYICIVLHF